MCLVSLLIGYLPSGIGLFHGRASTAFGYTARNRFRVMVFTYAGLGLVLLFLFFRLTPATEVPDAHLPSAGGLKAFFGVSRSHRVVLKLSSLFALDSFAGGFVIQSFAAYWFYLRFGVNPGTL